MTSSNLDFFFFSCLAESNQGAGEEGIWPRACLFRRANLPTRMCCKGGPEHKAPLIAIGEDNMTSILWAFRTICSARHL